MLLNKNVPRIQIDLMSRLRSHQLYEDTKLIETSPATTVPVGDHPTHSGCEMKSEAISPPSQSQVKETSREHGPATDARTTEALQVVRGWLSREDPFVTQGELFESLGISSGSKQTRIKKTLLKMNLIKEHRLSAGKSFIIIWEPTSKAFSQTGLNRTIHHSKGGWLHQFCAQRAKQWGTRRGYTVEVESFLSNGKAVDFVFRKPDHRILGEIAMSYPLEKELSNILKDFAGELQPDRFMILVKDREMKRALGQMIASDNRVSEYRDELEVVLAGDFVVKR